MITIKSKTLDEMRFDARNIFNHCIKAVEPRASIRKFCTVKDSVLSIGNHSFNLQNFKHVYVIGAGKASAPMASEIEHMIGNFITDGLISVKYEHAEALKRIKLVEAGHPIPDENGQTAAKQILKIAQSAAERDLILCLISGGGSALLPLPEDNLSLKDKQSTLSILLSCGATIHEINTIRKHISRIKGGKLSRAAYPAHIISLILSDVVGDNLDVIASGPTVADPTTFHDCLNIFKKYDVEKQMPEAVVNHIKSGISGNLKETPKPGDPIFLKNQNIIIGSNIEAISAGKKFAENIGYNTLILSTLIEGDTVESALFHSAIAKEIQKTGNPIPSPACILSGGETTVRIRGDGLGGRNQEFALASAIEIQDQENIVVLSAGTDGTDGPTDAAGAISDTFTIKNARLMGLEAQDYLLNNDSYHFFKTINDLFLTGPTKTNVMDLRIMLVI